MTTIDATGVPQQRRRRVRPTPPPLPAWTCVNCTHENPGRRWRCRDCGTTRD